MWLSLLCKTLIHSESNRLEPHLAPQLSFTLLQIKEPTLTLLPGGTEGVKPSRIITTNSGSLILYHTFLILSIVFLKLFIFLFGNHILQAQSIASMPRILIKNVLLMILQATFKHILFYIVIKYISSIYLIL
jgi:hypothetical protein